MPLIGDTHTPSRSGGSETTAAEADGVPGFYLPGPVLDAKPDMQFALDLGEESVITEEPFSHRCALQGIGL